MEDKENNRTGGETRESIRKARLENKKKLVSQAEQAVRQKSEASVRPEERPVYNPFFNYHKRRFPIWQRLIALISIAAIMLVLGAMFGYGALGHGNPWDVFNPATWQHILDFVRT
jgi:DNA-directed RNA polymerase subunit beta.